MKRSKHTRCTAEVVALGARYELGGERLVPGSVHAGRLVGALLACPVVSRNLRPVEPPGAPTPGEGPVEPEAAQNRSCGAVGSRGTRTRKGRGSR